jgi:hypothetical protein
MGYRVKFTPEQQAKLDLLGEYKITVFHSEDEGHKGTFFLTNIENNMLNPADRKIVRFATVDDAIAEIVQLRKDKDKYIWS